MPIFVINGQEQEFQYVYQLPYYLISLLIQQGKNYEDLKQLLDDNRDALTTRLIMSKDEYENLDGTRRSQVHMRTNQPDYILTDSNQMDIYLTTEWGVGTPTWNRLRNRLSLLPDDEKLVFDVVGEGQVNILNETTDMVVTNAEMNSKPLNLNTILYGPPGTGKTFNTVDKAWKILNVGNTNDTTRPGSIQELKSRYPGQVEFVTFHQSFSYEDFVEGIQAKTQDGKISYQIESGVFKRMAKEASENLAASQKTSEQLSFEMGIEAKLADFISNAITEEKSFSKKKGNPFYIVDSSNDERVKIMSKDTKHSDGVIELKLEDLKLVCMSEGEFSSPKDIAQQIFQKVHARQHDSYFLSILNEFKTFNSAQSYVENRGKVALKPYILIIDEINRGNISRIFGELITLIEPSKRAGNDEAIEVTLPYSKESFSVPNNLYIIGTMNTADRSLALMDTALRRRFDFIEMMPQPDLVTEDLEGIDLRKILQVMNQRIEALYDREHTLGHAFLMNVDSLKGLQQAFKNKILPLLEEYFYDDWQKIRWVLGASADNFYQRQSFGHLFTDADAPNDIEKFQRNNLDDLDAQAFVAIYQGA